MPIIKDLYMCIIKINISKYIKHIKGKIFFEEIILTRNFYYRIKNKNF